ncbi:histone-lysine N-methyltransferase SETDB1-like isoform X2 [Anabas testudineus]|nr:histone-lysine N-methyltransferase SETDB1-like isoform X2 [Anabas testudineus]
MDGDEIEISQEELQRLIEEEVKKSKLISPEVLEKCNMLHSLLKRREKQAAHLLELCESVVACEEVVKKQYSLLGWEYKDTHSDDDDNITDCGHSPPFPRDSFPSVRKDHRSPETKGPSLLQKMQQNEHLNSNKCKSSYKSLIREPVVVLTRLPHCMIPALRPSASQKNCSDDECISSVESDVQWEPDDDSSDSSYSISCSKTGSKKRRKRHEKNKKPTKSGAKPQASSHSEPQSKAMKTTTQTKSNTDAKNSPAKCSPPKASTDNSAKDNEEKTPVPEDSSSANTKNNKTKTLSSHKNTNGVTPMRISALCKSDETTKQTASSVPQQEVCVNTHVLARRREMNWQRGQVMQILQKEDGRVKYKVNFEEKGKSLVSGHHIAFSCMPKVEHLFVGARVVVKCPGDKPQFCPGILAEVPNRRNRMRFLVFTDDHKPIYVGLPSLHLVYKPLTDPLDDVTCSTHRNFMKEYLKMWPYPPQTQYKVGQVINSELNGIQERCEVQVVDCSLIQVLFQKDQHKEWIYRGSIRLQHMINLKEKK